MKLLNISGNNNPNSIFECCSRRRNVSGSALLELADFDKKNLKDILKLTDIYVEKRIIVKNNKEVLKYIQGHLEAASEGNDLT